MITSTLKNATPMQPYNQSLGGNEKMRAMIRPKLWPTPRHLRKDTYCGLAILRRANEGPKGWRARYRNQPLQNMITCTETTRYQPPKKRGCKYDNELNLPKKRVHPTYLEFMMNSNDQHWEVDQIIEIADQHWKVDHGIEIADQENFKAAFRAYFQQHSLKVYTTEGRQLGWETLEEDVLDKGSCRVYLKYDMRYNLRPRS
jgi:hypothetical protein